MIQLIPFLAGAVLLFFTLFLLLRHDPQSELHADTLTEARQALRSLETGLLPLDLVRRIFAKADSEYVAGESPAGVYRLFLEERRRIALGWVKQVRLRVLTLWRFHNRAARHAAELRLSAEIELAWNFAALLLACRALEALILVAGPFATPRIVGRTMRTAGRICQALRESVGPAPAMFPDSTHGSRDRASL